MDTLTAVLTLASLTMLAVVERTDHHRSTKHRKVRSQQKLALSCLKRIGDALRLERQASNGEAGIAQAPPRRGHRRYSTNVWVLAETVRALTQS